MFKKVLVANRGEIACRIIKTLKKMGIQSVAIYSEVDQFHPHVKLADEGYYLGYAKPQETYLNIDKIIEIAKFAKVDAIHPGYGFLSENPDFAHACEQHQIKFIGPNVKAMQLVGSKQAAKEALKNTDVPLIPGYQPKNPSDEMLIKASEDIGFPLLIKATHGGGGKGLKIVYDKKDFKHALESARREALNYFNCDELLLEKLIEQPRHLEVQILADEHGHVVHLFERDCSVQRRQQKIIEEAPAIHLSKDIREKLYQYAISVAQTLNYTNAGTVEFLLAPNNELYFMEMNARLQVEHPITEMITNLDLVEWQVRIAQGEKIGFSQPQKPNGHAIEVRICAEQPEHDFRPSQGKINQLHLPKIGRIDNGIECHQEISGFYDSLLVKEISWGETRKQSIHILQEMLLETRIQGVQTNLDYLKTILADNVWQHGAVAIDFLSHHHLVQEELPDSILLFASAILANHLEQLNNSLPSSLQHFSGIQKRFSPYTFLIDDLPHTIWINVQEQKLECKLENSEKRYQLFFDIENHHIYFNFEGKSHQLAFTTQKHEFNFYDKTRSYKIFRIFHQLSSHDHSVEKDIKAPMHATVVALYKQNGDNVSKGDALLVLEAMKMEHTIYAPQDGKIHEIFYQLGQQVQEGSLLLEIHYG